MTTVSACVLIRQRHVLLAQRPQGKFMAGVWEFPGGKTESNETPSQTLLRELQEEIGVIVSPEHIHLLAFATQHDAQQKPHTILLYVCRRWQGVPQGREQQALRWVTLDEMTRYPMPPANVTLLPTLTTFMTPLR